MKAALSVVLRVIALTIVLFISFAVAAGVVGLQDSSQSSEQAGGAALTLFAVCALETVVMAYLILRSRWAGWKLIAAVFVVFYGVTTFMSQIESAVFLTRLPSGMVPRLLLMGAVIGALFSPLAVLILGKRRLAAADTVSNSRLIMPGSEWAWKLAVIALAYLVLYFTFGYYIAWRNPAVPAYYGGTDPGSFFAQMGTVLRDTPWLVPFQIMRAMLWVALALPVIRMLKGEWPETAIAIGLLFSVVMNAQLLLPNPYMPEAVRMAHLVETASSNFIFGVLIGWLLTQRHSLARVSLPQAVT
jgi:hypothetical protein